MSGSSESSWVRRARPLLGTLVEVTAAAAPETMESAFAAIAEVQDRMSYHDPKSELSRLNREAAKGWVIITPELCVVLSCALDLARQSEGVFDPTVAVRLTSLGFLPPVPGSPVAHRAATWRDIEMDLENSRVRFHRALRLDLGGIAKGFAVDQAVAALQNAGVDAGLVNAGGDLRGFGPPQWPISIRHPQEPASVLATLPLQNAALATSAGTFTRRRRGGAEITALLDGRNRVPMGVESSVSVIAPTAMTADGLTKIALALGSSSEAILNRYRATAFLLDPQHGVYFVPPLSHAA